VPVFVRLFSLFALALPVHAGPDAQTILEKFLQHSETAASAEARNSFRYERVSRVEYLDDDGSVKKNTIRVYRVTPGTDEPVTKLISVNGRPATEQDEKNRSKARETGEKSRALTISRELLARYDFSFVREALFASRPAWVLAFTPKPGVKSDGFFDRLLNAMSGEFWIDQEDYQLARADVRMSKRVSFFGGFAGAIDKLDLTIIQRRIEPSVWLGEALHLDFAGRKLLSNVRFRCFENCFGFQKTPARHARAD
jgi:hypothetical protein